MENHGTSNLNLYYTPLDPTPLGVRAPRSYGVFGAILVFTVGPSLPPHFQISNPAPGPTEETSSLPDLGRNLPGPRQAKVRAFCSELHSEQKLSSPYNKYVPST